MPDPVSSSADDAILLAGKARALAEAELRAAEVRITAARVKVLAVLLSASYALAHQDIQAIVKIDRVTLYRVLASLIAAGLAHKISGDDRVSRYKATSNQEERNALRLPLQTAAQQRGRQHSHGHFQCTRCTRVFCLDHNREPGLLEDMFVGPDENGQKEMPEPLQAILLKTLGTGFQSHDIELIVKGWCADCAH